MQLKIKWLEGKSWSREVKINLRIFSTNAAFFFFCKRRKQRMPAITLYYNIYFIVAASFCFSAMLFFSQAGVLSFPLCVLKS